MGRKETDLQASVEPLYPGIPEAKLQSYIFFQISEPIQFLFIQAS